MDGSKQHTFPSDYILQAQLNRILWPSLKISKKDKQMFRWNCVRYTQSRTLLKANRMCEGKWTPQRLGVKWTQFGHPNERLVWHLFRRKTHTRIVRIWAKVLDHFERFGKLVKRQEQPIFTLKSRVCVGRSCYPIRDDIEKDKHETISFIRYEWINDTGPWISRRGCIFLHLPAAHASAVLDRPPRWFVCDMTISQTPVDCHLHRVRWSERWCSSP